MRCDPVGGISTGTKISCAEADAFIEHHGHSAIVSRERDFRGDTSLVNDAALDKLQIRRGQVKLSADVSTIVAPRAKLA